MGTATADLRVRLFSLSLCCLTACGVGVAEVEGSSANEEVFFVDETGERETSITKGQEDPGHPQVALILQYSEASYQNITGLCTGTLVGRRTVLTAAHCITAGAFYTATFKGVRYPVISVIAHPQGPKNPAFITYEETGYDLAVMILSDAPPVSPSPIAAQAPQLRSLLHLVGFGRTGDGRSDYGIKRSVTTMIWKLADTYYLQGEPIVGMGTTCQGDSGGPHFLKGLGRDVQVGVTSSGDCKTEGSSPRLDRHINWIREVSGGDVLVVNVPMFSTPASLGLDLFRPLGASCKQHIECRTGICTSDGYGFSYCAQGCNEHLPCPDWFECRPSPNLPGAGLCWPTAPQG